LVHGSSFFRLQISGISLYVHICTTRIGGVRMVKVQDIHKNLPSKTALKAVIRGDIQGKSPYTSAGVSSHRFLPEMKMGKCDRKVLDDYFPGKRRRIGTSDLRHWG